MLATHFQKRFEGASDDALRADIDPRASGHLAIHHQALPFELVEMFERRPASNKIAVRDQHARRIFVRTQDAHRLAGLNE